MQCRSKRHIFIIFVVLSFYLPLLSQEKKVNFFTPGMPSLSAQWGLAFPARRDLRNPTPSEEFIVAADFHELRLDSGIKYQCNQLDLTNRVIYMPTFYNNFQAGLGINWHLYRYIKEFTENDLTLTGRFRWIKGPVFTFENSLGILCKFTSIDVINSYKPVIYNFSYQHELLCNWHLNATNLWFALNLQDYFDYPLAISPFFKIGMDYTTKESLVLGLDFTMKFVDMFFSAVYLNEALLRFTFKVVL